MVATTFQFRGEPVTRIGRSFSGRFALCWPIQLPFGNGGLTLNRPFCYVSPARCIDEMLKSLYQGKIVRVRRRGMLSDLVTLRSENIGVSEKITLTLRGYLCARLYMFCFFIFTVIPLVI